MADTPHNGATATVAPRTPLEARLDADEARIAADEARLADDEMRLEKHEARLAADEQLLMNEEKVVKRNWWVLIGIGATLLLTITALVLSVFALHHRIDTVANADPRANSVGTAAIVNEAVTSDKLAPGSVTTPALTLGAVHNRNLVAGAIGAGKIRPDAVTGGKVAPDTLTGADINERTLGTVPAAATAGTAGTSGNAAALGGLPATRFLTGVKFVEGSSPTNYQPVKTVTVKAPAGYRVVGGGATLNGAYGKIAIFSSAPKSKTAWTATAGAIAANHGPWKLTVTAIVAARPS